MAVTKINTFVLLPVVPRKHEIHYGAVNAQGSSDKHLLPWAQELVNIAEETIKHANSYAPREQYENPHCYQTPIYPETEIDEDELIGQYGRQHLDFAKGERKKHILPLIPISGRKLTLLVAGHGSPIGIGAATGGPARISPENLADLTLSLIRDKIPQISSLSIRFLTCNSATPFCGTRFPAYGYNAAAAAPAPAPAPKATAAAAPKKDKEKIAKQKERKPLPEERGKIKDRPAPKAVIEDSFNTSFAGRFTHGLISSIKEDDEMRQFLTAMHISISGVAGYYQHHTNDIVKLFAINSCQGNGINLENGITTFTKNPGSEEISIQMPNIILHIPPTWLPGSPEIWRRNADEEPETLSDLRSHGLLERLDKVIPPEETEVRPFITSPQ